MAPPPGTQVLRYSQRTGSRTLTTLCLGDEEHFSTALFQVWKAWVALAHEQLPNVIVHTNQFLGENTFLQYGDLLTTTNVDMITIDSYDFLDGEA